MAIHEHIESRLRALHHRSGGSSFRDLLVAARGISRVMTADTSLVTSNGTTVTTAAYQVDMTTGDALIGGALGTIAALNDVDMLTHARACQLDGSAPVALAANGKTLIVAVVAILVSGAPQIAFVFGDAADDGEEVAPTGGECREALRAAEVANHNASGLGIIVGTVKVARAADAITLTHSAPATDDAVKAARLAGALG